MLVTSRLGCSIAALTLAAASVANGATRPGAFPSPSSYASTQPDPQKDNAWIDTTLDIDDLKDIDESYVAALRDHLGRYEHWIRAHDYVVARSADARVVLVTADKRTSKRRLALVEKTLTAFDALMAAPDRTGSDETFRAAAWGEGDHVPDAEPIVLIEVDEREQYTTLLTRLGDEHPGLAGWARAHAAQPGFAEGRYAVAAWQSAPDGFELGKVWRPEHELVHRLARLAVHRSYGPQPTWVSVGAAWQVEMEVHRSLYCFPYRSGFVGVGEHGGWKSEVRSLFKKRKKAPLRMDEFATWQRNTWNDDQSAIAWAFVQYLAKHEPGALSTVAETFRGLYKDGYRTTFPDGTWRTDPGYQIPVEDQERVLSEACGDGFLGRATEFFRTWRKPK